MRRLSLIFGLLSLLIVSFLSFRGKSPEQPHGQNFTLSCEKCHNSSGWKVDQSKISFSHDETNFSLTGQHKEVLCKQCHPSLIFKDAKSDCYTCHTDIHDHTVGIECSKCHTTNNWMVNNIHDIHRNSRFPLLGAHALADCQACHPSASLLHFKVLGINCIDCHLTDYQGTTKPNHASAGFSTNCNDCHFIHAFEWGTSGFNHEFFPLTLGHNIQECGKCHKTPDYSSTSPECFSCHEQDYNTANSPNHLNSKFPIDCKTCHTLNPGWKPSTFNHDGPYFPIYSGKHQGEWNDCSDCHNISGNFKAFSCIDCHEHSRANTDDKHDEVKNYSYNSNACFNCHPRGHAE